MQAAGAAEDVLPSWAYVHGVRHGFHPDDPLFAAGDADRLWGYQTVGKHPRRAPVASLPLSMSLETETGHAGHDEDDVYECTVPGCLQRFATATSYDTHFRSAHLNVCAECRKVTTAQRRQIHLRDVSQDRFAVRGHFSLPYARPSPANSGRKKSVCTFEGL